MKKHTLSDLQVLYHELQKAETRQEIARLQIALEYAFNAVREDEAEQFEAWAARQANLDNEN